MHVSVFYIILCKDKTFTGDILIKCHHRDTYIVDRTACYNNPMPRHAGIHRPLNERENSLRLDFRHWADSEAEVRLELPRRAPMA